MDLLRTEFRKIFPYRTFWAILGIYILLLLLVTFASSSVVVNGEAYGKTMYQFPQIWLRLAYIGSFFNVLLGILVIILVTDEYTFRTFRQQVIDGLSRAELVLAKFYVGLALATFCTLVILVLGFVLGLLYSTDQSASAVFSQLDAIPYFFVQAVAYISLAMLFGFLIRKSGLAIIAFFVYTILVEPLIHYSLPDTVDKFFPIKVFSSLTPRPGQALIDQITSPTEMLTPQWAVLPALVYIALLVAAAYLILKLRDL